jgi:hypothetical protein
LAELAGGVGGEGLGAGAGGVGDVGEVGDDEVVPEPLLLDVLELVAPLVLVEPPVLVVELASLGEAVVPASEVPWLQPISTRPSSIAARHRPKLTARIA